MIYSGGERVKEAANKQALNVGHLSTRNIQNVPLGVTECSGWLRNCDPIIFERWCLSCLSEITVIMLVRLFRYLLYHKQQLEIPIYWTIETEKRPEMFKIIKWELEREILIITIEKSWGTFAKALSLVVDSINILLKCYLYLEILRHIRCDR